MRIEVVVAAPDEEYIRSFTAYVHQSDAARKISLRCFTLMDHFQEWCQRGQADILVVDHAWYQDMIGIQQLPFERICLLIEQEAAKPFITSGESQQLRTIFKYQSAAKTIQTLLSIMRLNEASDAGSSQRFGSDSFILAIYSSAGGCGKTTLAINALKELAEQNFQVLYVGLEAFSLLDCYMKVEKEGDFSTLLYYMHNKPEHVMTALERSIQYDEQFGAYYIPPLEQISDIQDIRREDVIFLLHQLKQMARFDFIVIDLDSAVSSRTEGALLGADLIWWLITDDLHCLHKTKKMRQFWSFLNDADAAIESKTQLILYRYYGQLANRIEDELGRTAGTIPYIPEWKQLHQSKTLLNSVLYSEHVRKMIDSLIKTKGEHRHESIIL